MEPFIVENAVNSCYIDSLLVALFFSRSVFENMLTTDPKTPQVIYLQEYIRLNFVEYIRNNKSVLEDSINTIRDLCTKCGWINDKLQQQHVHEFYTFLLDQFNAPKIETKNKQKCYTTWEDINNKNIQNSPYILGIHLDKQLDRVDIPKKIHPTAQVFPFYHEWDFHAAICICNNHYYTLLVHEKQFLIFDDKKVPCLQLVDMSDTILIKRIKTESIFLIYRA
jgi:hypothetical protein